MLSFSEFPLWPSLELFVCPRLSRIECIKPVLSQFRRPVIRNLHVKLVKIALIMLIIPNVMLTHDIINNLQYLKLTCLTYLPIFSRIFGSQIKMLTIYKIADLFWVIPVIPLIIPSPSLLEGENCFSNNRKNLYCNHNHH